MDHPRKTEKARQQDETLHPPTEHDFAHEQHTHQAPELYPAVSTWHISGMMEKLPRVQACELMLADLVRRYFSNGLGSYSLRKHHQHAVVSCRKTIRVRRGHTNPAPSIQLKPLMLQGILGRDSQTWVRSSNPAQCVPRIQEHTNMLQPVTAL